MFKYIEIRRDIDNEIVKRMDVTNKSDRHIEKAIKGIMINMNMSDYTVYSKSYKVPQIVK